MFSSFWIAGYESSCHLNSLGARVDMLEATQHDRLVREDYRLLRHAGITTARDGIRWHLIDSGGRYDFSSFLPMLAAARENGIQVIWDLCHYGWPDDVNVFSAAFVDRFARFSRAVARVIADSGDAVPFYIPVNEMSFLSYAIGGKCIYPFVSGRDFELKRQFARASLAAVDAVRGVDRRARIIFADPVVRVVEPRNRPELRAAARAYDEAQFEAWDMIAGRLEPGLGGAPECLDIVGVNYYHANQFEYSGDRLRWEDHPRDSRMVPFHRLVERVYRRYSRPMLIAETSHFGVGRVPWIAEIAAEVGQARRHGAPVEAVCLYPIVDRPDWNNPQHWHHSGLWDVHRNPDGSLLRVLNPEYAAELRRLQQKPFLRAKTASERFCGQEIAISIPDAERHS